MMDPTQNPDHSQEPLSGSGSVPPPRADVRAEADARFRRLAAEVGMNPDERFVGGYVDWEWERARHLFEDLYFSVQGKSVLELGCNVGATSIVLAALGARVTGVDTNPRFVELARANAERYGKDARTRFIHVPDTRRLPFENEHFDIVSCTSVLEYVAKDHLPHLQQEIDRVLARGGFIAVSSTSNRIYPLELHSAYRPINYLPHQLDRFIWGKEKVRGVWPWQLRSGFGDYDDITAIDGGRRLLELKERMGASRARLMAVSAANRMLSPFGLHFGHIAPHITMILQKRLSQGRKQEA